MMESCRDSWRHRFLDSRNFESGTLPVIIHLARGSDRQFCAFQTRDKMEAHVQAGGNPRRSYNRSAIHPTLFALNLNVGKHRAKIFDVFPMCRDSFAAKQSSFAQEKCARANRCRERRLGRSLSDPLNDWIAIQFRRNHVAGYDENFYGRMMGDVEIRLQHQATARADGASGISNGKYSKRLFAPRLRTKFHSRRRGKHLERPAQIKHLDFITNVNADVASHGLSVCSTR